ncbi:MAG: DUF2569 family protein [Nanoarchaeota archaeon]
MAKKEGKVNLSGLGGWLILLIINLFFMGIAFVVSGVIDIVLLFRGKFMVFVWLSLLFAILISFSSIYSIILAFSKKKKFIKWMRITLWIYIIDGLVMLILGFEKSYSNVIRIVLISIISLIYLSKSIRVKNTFIR